MKKTIDYYCPKCGKKMRSVCTAQWQVDYVEKHRLGKMCDNCVLSTQPKYSKVDAGDARIESVNHAKELHDQAEDDLKCQNM